MNCDSYFALSKRVFATKFGVSKETVQIIFNILSNKDDTIEMEHLLYTLNWLKEYTTFDSLALSWNHSSVTIQMWIWTTIKSIFQNLKTVLIC